jgi:RimJ/RimL family protein N-acetyltransferase
VLRTWTLDDAEAMQRAILESLDHLRPWMWWVSDEPMTLEQRYDLITAFEQSRLEGGDVVYGVFLEGEPIGGTGLHRRPGPTGLEIGYWIHVDHLGHGYATELARVLTDTALSLDGIDMVEIHHDRANQRSRRVPEKLGYTVISEVPKEPRAPAEVGMDVCWRTTSSTWGTRSGPARPLRGEV